MEMPRYRKYPRITISLADIEQNKPETSRSMSDTK